MHLSKKQTTFLKSKLWPRSLWRRVLIVFSVILIMFTATSYGVAEWYIHKHANEPTIIGATFTSDYAESFDLDPKQTLQAMLSDLKIKQVRLVSYWDQIEPVQGKYDFANLDWQFAMANTYGTKVSLAIGLRQPRWPECHEPDWAKASDKNVWQPKLYNFISAVVDRYKNNPALNTYELENEFFMKVFGKCTDFDRSRLVAEFNLVKKADTKHKVIISRSDNWVGIPIGEPVPDQYAVSIYKRVWDYTFTHRYFEYPLPPWFYASLAGYGELVSGKDMVIHELQAEPWPPKGQNLHTASLDEQFKSMNADRLKERINFAEDTGIKGIGLWGAEWWYWLKEKQNDPSVWNVVKQAVVDADQKNQKLTSHN